MVLGAMMAGGNPKDGRQKDDFYPTPPEVTIALLDQFKFETNGEKDFLWDCAAGDGAMLNVFDKFGYKNLGSDVEPRKLNIEKRDFLEIKKNSAFSTTIITNPPFNLAEQFIRHSFDIGTKKLALVLKSTFFHAKSRYPLFEEHTPSYVCPLLWRPDFLNKGRPTMEVSWFIWDKTNCNDSAIYMPLPKPI